MIQTGWCPRPELNRDQTFRKRLLYPFELRGRPTAIFYAPTLGCGLQVDNPPLRSSF